MSKTNNVKTNVNIELLSPLSHFGDERMGTMQLMRTHKLRYSDEFIDVPCYSGNAFRGIFRRKLMRDYLERIGVVQTVTDEEKLQQVCEKFDVHYYNSDYVYLSNIKFDTYDEFIDEAVKYLAVNNIPTKDMLITLKPKGEFQKVKMGKTTEDVFEAFMKEEVIDLRISQLISKNLYYMLFTGGALTGGARHEEVGERRKIRKMCPPLALLGTALGSQIPAGKMKSSIFLPICKETADYTGIEEELSFYDMLEDMFYTRRDDLKSVEANIKEDDNKKKKKENATQMKYEMQCLAAGTKLNGQIVLENANKVEESCLHAGLKLIEEMPYIGGKASAGHGKIKIEFDELENIKTYYGYLEEHKEEMRTWVREVEKELK